MKVQTHFLFLLFPFLKIYSPLISLPIKAVRCERKSSLIMKLIKQDLSLEINTLDEILENKLNYVKHSQLLPNSIRCIICGPSNCGKTNVILSLLLHPNGLKFQNVYLYSKTAFQPKYKFLNIVLKSVPEVNFYIYEDNSIIHPNEALSNSVIIFDDVVCEDQTNIRNYFAMGRHKQLDCFYLTQTYSKIPKQLIRDNVNLLILFKQDDLNMKHVFEEHVNSDIPWFEFKNLCTTVWKKPHDFLVINKECAINKGRYRKGFDTYIKFD